MATFLRKTILFCLGIPVILFCLGYAEMTIKPLKEFSFLKMVLPSTDVLLFGSSVNRYYAKEDTDKRAISEMLDSLLISEKVTGLSHVAYQSEVYLEYVKYISKTSKKKPFLIVPINLRCFSPEWDLRPQYQFIKERYEIAGLPYIYNFKRYKEISATEFEAQPIFFQDKNIGNIGNITAQYEQQDKETVMHNGLIFHYMQTLEPNHRKLRALNSIAKLCSASDIGLMMYISPIDIQQAEALNIDGFKKKVLKNIAVIKKNLEEESVDLLDMSFYLDSAYFDYESIPNEHLNMGGRLKVAERIKEKMRD